VTPDRDLALRVTAHLERWGIQGDDSAGLRLSATPAGTLILALVTAAASSFAPVDLLALLKHPLARAGEDRLAWLDGTRRLDIALRGPRPAPGLGGITAFLTSGDERTAPIRLRALDWWQDVAALLGPLETAFNGTAPDLRAMIAILRETILALAGDNAWAGQAGRAAADLISDLDVHGGSGPLDIQPAMLPAMLSQLMDGVSVRAPSGGHPRVFIWGLLEAKLQSAQMMILGGLNEGVWPALPTPDPWLAPAIRRHLGLPSLERRIGLSAHDLAGALGAPEVLLTRAARDSSAPTIASRFWLRLEAMGDGLSPPTERFDLLARALDMPTQDPRLAPRPAPCPPTAARPKSIAVTAIDGLKADPFSFYAKAILRLSKLEQVDAEPGAAWRGSVIHRVLEDWARKDDYDRDALIPRIKDLLVQPGIHPLLRTFWQPKLVEAGQWIADLVAIGRSEGRTPLAAEEKGEVEVGGITLRGRIDRVDQLPEGGLCIVDYKTGTEPKPKKIEAGFALQLGLMGLMAEMGGFAGVSGIAKDFEYWLLSRDTNTRQFGKLKKALGGKNAKLDPADFTSFAHDELMNVADKWLTGAEPFTAKLHPEHALYGDYDQLMRLQEWYGRG
jgi:ATP-dependent helicase/nuclease subunit B